MNIYEFDVKRANGEVISMEQFKNKPLLIVNTANHCGFTYQFEDLQKLYEKFNDRSRMLETKGLMAGIVVQQLSQLLSIWLVSVQEIHLLMYRFQGLVVFRTGRTLLSLY